MSLFSLIFFRSNTEAAVRSYPLLVRQHNVLGDALRAQQREFARLNAIVPNPGPAVQQLRNDLARAEALHTETGNEFLRMHRLLKSAADQLVREGKMDANAVRFDPALSGPLIPIVVILAAVVAIVASVLGPSWFRMVGNQKSRQDALKPQITANDRLLKLYTDEVAAAQASGRVPPSPPTLIPIPLPEAGPSGSLITAGVSLTPLLVVGGVGLAVLLLGRRRS